MAAPAQVVAMPQTMPVFGILDDHDDEDLAIITDYLLEGGDLGVDDWTGGGAEALPSSSSSSSAAAAQDAPLEMTGGMFGGPLDADPSAAGGRRSTRTRAPRQRLSAPPPAPLAKRPAAAAQAGGAAKRGRKAGGTAKAPPKAQAQGDRRRERNRILARRTRMRKKFFFESLQKQVTELQRENDALKELVRGEAKIPDAVMAACEHAAQEDVPVVTDATNDKATELLHQSDYTLMRTLQHTQRSFCITDPSMPDNPIVYASQSFLDTTGYTMPQVLGRNCRFLQGPDSDPDKVAKIREAVAEGVDVSVCMLNYRADGTVFWNQCFVAALRDVNNKIVNYVGVQCHVPMPPPEDTEFDKSAGAKWPADGSGGKDEEF